MPSDVTVVGVTKSFRSIQAVDNVSFEVPSGSVLTLLGPSGCGKTTTLRMIAGFVTPDRGDIYIREKRVNRLPPYRRDTAMVFQNYALFPHMTVYQNVAFGLKYRSGDAREERARVGTALEQVRLQGLDSRYPSQLSGGQQQRVALARAIVTRPAVLLLDEPLSNLDLRLRQAMRHELRTIQTNLGVTSVYVTHDQAEAFSMSDRIALMNQGAIVQLGTPDEIFHRPKSEFVLSFIGETNKFRCTVTGHRPNEIFVRTEEDLDFRAQFPTSDQSRHPEGASRWLFFREEQVRLVTDLGAPNSFRVTVRTVQNLGSMQTLTLELSAGAVIRATVPTTARNTFNPADHLVAEVDPADCILIERG